MMALSIKPSQKVKQYARVCLWGVPKAGKSHTALTLATAFAGDGGKVGVISSEYGSTKLLAHKFPHDIIDLAEADEFGRAPRNPFAPERYGEALKLFLDAGYKAIVIDSLSHAWAGTGGILEMVGDGGFSDGWGKKGDPAYNKLIDALLSARCHIIVTLRAKDAYVMEEYTKRNGERGTSPKNVGQAPVMRKGFGFEMQLTVRMDSLTAYIEASAVEDHIQKGEEIERPGPELAYRLLDALDGVEVPEPTPQESRINTCLGEFKAFYALYCAKTPDWKVQFLHKALDIAEVESLPEVYSDDDAMRIELYLATKKAARQQKVAASGK